MYRLPYQWWKQPNTYFVLVPILAGIWAFTAGAVLYPRSVQNWQGQQETYRDAEKELERLLQLEPGRLAYEAEAGGSADFDYTDQVDKFAKLFRISDKDYTLSTRSIVRRSDRRSRSADLNIKTIDIETLAKFISAMQIRWSDLQVDQITLEKLDTAKDAWKVTLRLNYFY